MLDNFIYSPDTSKIEKEPMFWSGSANHGWVHFNVAAQYSSRNLIDLPDPSVGWDARFVSIEQAEEVLANWFAENEGEFCPACISSNIATKDFDPAGITARVTCADCGTVIFPIYRIDGVGFDYCKREYKVDPPKERLNFFLKGVLAIIEHLDAKNPLKAIELARSMIQKEVGGHKPNPVLPSPKPVAPESVQSSPKRRIGLQVFVATNQSQGMFPDDFNLVAEGEFVVPPSDIGPDNKKVMVGIVTAKSTTTFKVVPLDIPRAHFVHLIAEFYLRAGWVNFPQKAQEMAKETVADIFATARHYRIGDIVGKSEGTTYYQRG